MIETFSGLVWVALGAAIGGPMRFFVSGVVARSIGETFPWGTLVVNVTGAFLVGAIAAIMSARGLNSTTAPWLLAVTGLLGSYTTVSSFSLQTLRLVQNGEQQRALGNAGMSLGFCLAAAAAGFALASMAMR